MADVRVEWVQIDEFPLVKRIIAHEVAENLALNAEKTITAPVKSTSRNLGEAGYGINAVMISITSATGAILVAKGDEAPLDNTEQNDPSDNTKDRPGILVRQGESRFVMRAYDGMELSFVVDTA